MGSKSHDIVSIIRSLNREYKEQYGGDTDIFDTSKSPPEVNIPNSTVSYEDKVGTDLQTLGVYSQDPQLQGGDAVVLLDTTNNTITVDVSSGVYENGSVVIVKDAGGNASTNGILVTGLGIDRQINTSYGYLKMVYHEGTMYTIGSE